MSSLTSLYGFMPYPRVESNHASSGPLSGVSFAVKDLFDIRGYPTSWGQPLILAKSGIKDTTAPSIQKLLEKGAQLLGKTVTEEFAFSLIGENVHFGAPLNSASPDRYAGGSSSGSAAAVAAGLVDFAIGTDTGGSVRAPASNCGLFGIRPTHGRVSLEGAMDLAPSFDTLGWFARDMNMLKRVAEVLLDEDTCTLGSAVRMLEPHDVWSELSSDVAAAFDEALKNLRQSFIRVETHSIALSSFDEMLTHFRTMQGFEAWKNHGEFLTTEFPVLGPGIAARFDTASRISKADYASGLAFQERFRTHIDAMVNTDSVLVIPTMTEPAPLRGTPESALDAYRAKTFRVLCISGLASLPQITLPLVAHRGAHFGLSLVGPRGSDRSLVDLASQVAQAFRR
ncbi:MAG: amidase [Betaproteobacteria bacterium]|nr:amidase [Betaproteobacteria bacterium]NDH58027.1 amidase [Betaproteobacteria bacterium]